MRRGRVAVAHAVGVAMTDDIFDHGPNAFGRELAYWRKLARKTLRDVANFLGVSISYVSDVERGRRRALGFDDCVRLAAYFSVDGLHVEPFVFLRAATNDNRCLEYVGTQEKRELLAIFAMALDSEDGTPTLLAQLRYILGREHMQAMERVRKAGRP